MRDPLDELIEDLEKAIPATQGFVPDFPSCSDMQMAICPLLWGSPEAIERSKTDPAAQRYWAWVEAHAKPVDGTKAAAAPVSDEPRDVLLQRLFNEEP